MSDLTGTLSLATTALQNRAAPSSMKTTNPTEARETAEDFESYFISQFLSSMFKGIKTDGPFGGGHGEEMYRGLMMNEYGKAIAADGGFGIADAIEREMLAMQEVK